jgi:hypothetical protein
MKRCPECGLTKARGDFHRRRDRSDGLTRNCADCTKARWRKTQAHLYKTRRRNRAEVFSQGCIKCATCAKLKHPDLYAISNRSSSGHAWRCRHCEHDRRLQSKYKISAYDWGNMWSAQGGLCAGCENHLTGGWTTQVDHCHKTGKVRGLLCNRCNTTLARVRDDPCYLRRLANYVENYRGVS